VKKEKIANIYRSLQMYNPMSDDIRKFEAQGTRSFPAEEASVTLSISKCYWHDRKEARLRLFEKLLADQVKNVPKVKIHTSLKDGYHAPFVVFQ
jgi:hypothetical protein